MTSAPACPPEPRTDAPPAADAAAAGGRSPRVPVVGFDLDMTLVDSRDGIAATLGAVLAEVGVTVTVADTWPYAGLPLDLILAGLAPGTPPEELEVLQARYRALYPSLGIESVRAYPGAATALAAPAAHGGRSVVVSAKHTPNVHRVLAVAGLAGAVREADVAGDLFAEDKGARLAQLGATAYVGDHPGDVRAAAVAGAVAVGVPTGAHDTAALLDAGADVVLPRLEDFPDWLATHVQDLRAGGARGEGERAAPLPG
ncbi:HAD family hydrolase [Kineococcus sp. LSe6-4]|uniref:HAD family hydrolase n=1 Tax=Kineococcus halophytocola TaxID=3234027 RepID=A0ABV4H354_9ACTN